MMFNCNTNEQEIDLPCLPKKDARRAFKQQQLFVAIVIDTEMLNFVGLNRLGVDIV